MAKLLVTGTEKFEPVAVFKNLKRYTYTSYGGMVFECYAKTIEDAHKLRDEWLDKLADFKL